MLACIKNSLKCGIIKYSHILTVVKSAVNLLKACLKQRVIVT